MVTLPAASVPTLMPSTRRNEAVGSEVGLGVGKEVGGADGTAVGNAVGNGDGDVVGREVGSGDGLAVGWPKTSPSLTHM